jgi:hypothetical protein
VRQFKLQCRKLGIRRWPYRKLKGLSTAIETCRLAASSHAASTAAAAASSTSSASKAPFVDPAVWADRLVELQARAAPHCRSLDRG